MKSVNYKINHKNRYKSHKYFVSQSWNLEILKPLSVQYRFRNQNFEVSILVLEDAGYRSRSQIKISFKKKIKVPVSKGEVSTTAWQWVIADTCMTMTKWTEFTVCYTRIRK